ncbi:CAP domain-containing protein [Roseibium polysiphoniae]|uniref:CAP domain-containing protein n=1 Tax=Roseibium polysiphoniae TaxID=2571221 RepID=UPI003297CC18
MMALRNLLGARPRAFILITLLLIAGLQLSGCGGLQSGKELEDAPVISNVPVDGNDMLAKLNSYRAANGLYPLTLDDTLNEVSIAMARHIAERDSMDTWAHSDFGLSQRLEKAGYRNYAGAENLGAGYASLDAAMAGWKGSAGHNKNLLNPYVTRVGIGRMVRSNGKWRNFWAMTLSRPAADGRPSLR